MIYYERTDLNGEPISLRRDGILVGYGIKAHKTSEFYDLDEILRALREWPKPAAYPDYANPYMAAILEVRRWLEDKYHAK